MDTKYTERLEKIEAVLDTWLPEKPDSQWLEKVFGPFSPGSSLDHSLCTSTGSFVSPELAASLTRPGWDLVKRGGKRWRPLLMVLMAESIAGEAGGEAALPLTPLVEFPHNASLIHDDIEDCSDERRGKPAVHLIYGTDTAINSGAFMYFLPLACLSAWPGNLGGAENPASTNPGAYHCASLCLKEQICTAWASHMRALHLGQAMDISWHRDFHSLPSLEEYDRMCRLKTGCLASLAAVLGVYCAFATKKDFFAGNFFPAESLIALSGFFGEAAEQLGVGFQILDDVKNLDVGVPGKKRGDDIVEGKKSLPILLYLHRYPEKRDFAARCFAAARSAGIGASEVEEIISALEEEGILEEARDKGLDYIHKSRDIFSAHSAAGFPLQKEGRELLAGLIDQLKFN